MSKRKVYSILDFIRRQGRLPTDPFDQILAVDDLLSWFGLDECLSAGERRQLRLELGVMAEAQQALEELQMARQLDSASD